MKTNPWQTSLTLVHDLRSSEVTLRSERIATLVRIYRPLWLHITRNTLGTHAAGQIDLQATAEDIVSDEIARMISPSPDYFATYDRARGRLGRWIDTRRRNRAIDLLRRNRTLPMPDELPAPPSDEQNQLDMLEMNELIKESFRLAEVLTEQAGESENMEIFRAIRMKSQYLPKEARLAKGWTEFQERKAVKQIWDLIRDTTIPLAADSISSSPEDAIKIAQKMWDFLKPRGLISDPREETII